MSIQHVINWVEGAPDEIVPGMALITKAGIAIVGKFDEGLNPSTFGHVIRHAQLIKPYELEWALSMGTKRELAS